MPIVKLTIAHINTNDLLSPMTIPLLIAHNLSMGRPRSNLPSNADPSQRQEVIFERVLKLKQPKPVLHTERTNFRYSLGNHHSVQLMLKELIDYIVP